MLVSTRYIGSIDQGTTSTRFSIFDNNGNIIAKHQLEHHQIYPHPGSVEHDPLEIWQRTQDVISIVLKGSGINPTKIAGLGITNQRETTVIWDRNTGKPFGNAIVWQSLHSAEICESLARDGGTDRFRSKVGLPISPYFSGPKIKWLLDNIPGARKAAEKGNALFGNIDTWLIWWLTGGPDKGVHTTDVTNASRTMLMDLKKMDWDMEILKILEIPHQMMPEIKSSIEPKAYGFTVKEGPFGTSIPICGDLGDQQAALFGQTCFHPGDAKNTYGTGCFLLLNTGTQPVPSTHGLLTTLGYRISGSPAVYCLEAPIAMAGSVVQWLRDNMKIINTSSEIEALAAEAEDNGGVYLVPAFSGLLAPYWDTRARGTLIGLTGYSNRSHIARAVLEATAFQTKDLFEVMEEDSKVKLNQLKVDGGMVVNNLLMQFQADILGIPVIRPKVTETTSVGAAYAAGLAAGVWRDTEELTMKWTIDQVWQPKMDKETINKLCTGWRKAVQRSCEWA
jgi:glycerol kinase